MHPIKYPKLNVPRDRLYLWGLCGLILIGAAVRLAYINQPMRGDESWSFLDFASRPLSEGLSNYWTTNNHLFHTLFMHLAYITLGNEPQWLRLPAFFAGILLIPATYRVGADFYSRDAGLIGAALVASSSVLVEFSTSARGYTMMILFFLLLLIISTRLLRRATVGRWAAFSVCAALGVYTLPLMAYPLGVVTLWLAVSIWTGTRGALRWRMLRQFAASLIAAGLLAALLYLPVVIYMSSGVETRSDYQHLRALELDKFAVFLLGSTFTGWALWIRDLPLPVVVTLAFGFVIGVIAHRRLARYRVSLVAVTLVAVPAMLLVQRVPTFERLWLFLLPVFCVIASAGILDAVGKLRSKQAQGWVGVAALVLALWLAFIVAGSRAIHRSVQTGVVPDGERVAAYLMAEAQPADLILCDQNCHYSVLYYADRARVPLTVAFQITPQMTPTRTLVVLNHLFSDDLNVYLAAVGFDTSAYAAPELLRQFDDADVYVLTPR